MSLAKYKEKRTFDQTPEPAGGKASGAQLRFVIQKHAASHLHYDFRLEMEGVLKSWAVPKGPSTDPEVKRLAMMVEDHPYDYRSFEGIIPEGNYGAGTVIVWDEGTYEAADLKGKSKKEQEKSLLHELHQGKIKFVLHGKKLKGEYALVKAHGRGENGWLLMKLEDKYASTDDITLKDKSVTSKKTLEQVKKTTTNIYGESATKSSNAKSKSVAAAKDTKKASPGKAKKKDLAGDDVPALLEKGRKAPFPKLMAPMLATLVDEPFDKEGWVYEVKWDGYRAVAYSNKGSVELASRNNKSFNEKFYPVCDAVKAWGINAVVDGEIVVVNEHGITNFNALQNWRSEADGELLYYVFDLLWLDGRDITELPLIERRELLRSQMPDNSIIRLSETFDATGTEFFALAQKIGLEGIMAKKADSQYLPGDRTTNWLKIKTSLRQEVVIGGFTRNEDTAKPFSSLLVGVYDKGHLVYTGKIGTGFSIKSQKDMMAKLRPLIVKDPPFSSVPDVNKPSRFRPDPPKATATWLKPELVCEVSFREMTEDGVMRHPSYEVMREDKDPKTIVAEKQQPTADVVKESKKLSQKKIIVPTGKKERKTLLNPTDETQVRTIGGHELKFTNLSKVYWPADKVTKRDMLNYYYQVAPYILPYLKNRPQSMNRFPDGINGESFYYKDVTGKAPDWIETYLYHSDADDRDRNYLVCTDEASLLYMASLGCIEMNPWSSTVQHSDHPTWCIIDLDPDKNTFDHVIKAAQVTKDVLDAMGVECYCKTSGSTGMHIYIPLGAKYTYEQSKEFARAVVTEVHHELPTFTTIERMTAKRNGKMYLDFLQNRPQATIAAPYALRPKPGATVSMPLHWDEVKKGLEMKDFTIFNAMARLNSVGDIFKPVVGKGVNLAKVMKKIGV